jgi:hypothetical protein
MTIISGPALLAALVTLVSCTHSTRHALPTPNSNREIVRVEEDLSAMPVGTVVHLCMRNLPCVIDTTRSGNRSGTQSIDLPLPAGLSAEDARGWPLRAYATASEDRFIAWTHIVYHVSIDPACECAGDYAYVRLVHQKPEH